MSFIIVLFPLPLSPTKAILSPFLTLKLTFTRTFSCPYPNVTSLKLIIGESAITSSLRILTESVITSSLLTPVDTSFSDWISMTSNTLDTETNAVCERTTN